VSRLARSSADWHRLLDLCGWTDVLIADEQAVFAVNDPNDRLLLGLKGQMSEAEKYWMRLRLQGAQLSKARRGELRLNAPIGYVWDRTAQRFELDPDREVQQVVQLIFERFRIDGSAGAVAAYFMDHGLALAGRRSTGEVFRSPPRTGGVINVLHNPVYAGVYVYGRREFRTAWVDGELRRNHVRRLPMEAWKVQIADRHAAYISWEEFVANQDKLRKNWNGRRSPDQPGAARGGEALLQGLVLCGCCGHRMTVQQGGQQRARYVCAGPIQQGTSSKVCWSVSAAAIDAVVVRHFLEAAQPPELELSLAVTREVEHQAEEIDKLWKSRLERARYEAQLAERRYKAVDPDNRVVARTLEGDWETKLRALEELEGGYRSARQARQVELSDADRTEILSLARDLARVWSATTTTNAQRKNLIRMLVQQVSLMPVDIPRRTTRIQILWQTGAVTDSTANRPRYAAGTPACDDAVEHIRMRAGEGWRDGQIALELNRRGLASGKRRPWNEQMVRGVRKRRGIPSQNAPMPGRGWGLERCDGLLSLRGVAERLGVSTRAVRAWVEAGRLTPTEGGGRGAPLWFAIDAETEQRLRNE
jgi:Recombinase zinc beta ribbon domain/Recombinase